MSTPPSPDELVDTEGAEEPETQRLLDRYLRDHHAGAVAGVALVRSCHHNNVGSQLAARLAFAD